MRIDTNIRSVNIKCDFCPESCLDSEGQLMCPHFQCTLSNTDIMYMLKTMFGKNSNDN